MKKTFVTTLSICAFLTLASANAQDATTATTVAKKSHKKSEKSSEVSAKELGLRTEIEKNASCANILGECKKLGFVAGGFKEGKGLWRNCFNPTIKGKSASLLGKDVSVTTNATDLETCKATVKEVRKVKRAAKGKKDKTADANAAPAAAPAAAE